MGKLKTTTVSRVIRIPLVIWDKYNLGDAVFEADWYDAMDEDVEKKVDGYQSIIIHFRKPEQEKK